MTPIKIFKGYVAALIKIFNGFLFNSATFMGSWEVGAWRSWDGFGTVVSVGVSLLVRSRPLRSASSRCVLRAERELPIYYTIERARREKGGGVSVRG